MVYQDENNNCGEFALRNLLRIVTKSKAYYYLPFQKEIKSFYDMKEELVENGFEATCYNYLNVDSLKGKKVYIEQFKGKEDNHFVVIKRLMFNSLFKVIDSNKGTYYLTSKGLKSRSNRNVLVIDKYPQNKICLNVVRNSDKVLYSSIVLFEYITFLLLYFVGLSENYLFYVFVTLLFLLTFLDKAYLTRISNRFDKEKIVSYLDEYDEEEFKFINEFKANYIKELNFKISGFFLLLSILFSSIFIDLKYLFLLILVSLFSLFFEKVFEIKLSKIENDILKKELGMKENKKIDESVFEDSKRYSLLFNFKNIILFMASFIFAFFISKGNMIETVFLMFLSFYISNKVVELKRYLHSSKSSLKMLRKSHKNLKNNVFFKVSPLK